MDYQNWGSYQRPPPKPKAQFVSPVDDRDFKTCISSTYVTHSVNRLLAKPPVHSIPKGNKFEGITTQKQDYKSWPVKAREQRKKQEWVPSPDRMNGHSVYEDSYGPKDAEKVKRYIKQYFNNKHGTQVPTNRLW